MFENKVKSIIEKRKHLANPDKRHDCLSRIDDVTTFTTNKKGTFPSLARLTKRQKKGELLYGYVYYIRHLRLVVEAVLIHKLF